MKLTFAPFRLMDSSRHTLIRHVAREGDHQQAQRVFAALEKRARKDGTPIHYDDGSRFFRQWVAIEEEVEITHIDGKKTITVRQVSNDNSQGLFQIEDVTISADDQVTKVFGRRVWRAID